MRRSEDGSPKRFQIDLFIVHPSVDPEELSIQLQLAGDFHHRSGESRHTPAGTRLSGTHSDTRWRHTVRYETEKDRFADQLASFLNGIEHHREYLAKLVATGGTLHLILKFLGDGYFGDSIPRFTLCKLSELGLNLGIEVFLEPQS